MKTLKRGNDFKRLKDSSVEDHKVIDQLIKSGWNYSNKKDWKDSLKSNKIDNKNDEKSTKKTKKNK